MNGSIKCKVKRPLLHPHLKQLERLLEHSFEITKEYLRDRVKKIVERDLNTLKCRSLGIDISKVNWPDIIRGAIYREPPFKEGDSEEGFRDALIAESFLQLVGDCPEEWNVCRIALLTNDKRMKQAIQGRIGGLSHVMLLSGIDELKGMINTLVARVDEGLIKRLTEKAEKVFFTEENFEKSLYSTADVQRQIWRKFNSALLKGPN